MSTGARVRETVLWLGAALGTICLAWTAFVLAFGLTPLVFTSGSMSPAIEAGDLAFARTVEAKQIAVGDIVSVVSAEDVRITHRVVKVEHAGDSAVLELKGDANHVADADPYTVTSVERTWFVVPKAGYVIDAASSPVGMFGGGLLVAVVLMLAFGPRSKVEVPA